MVPIAVVVHNPIYFLSQLPTVITLRNFHTCDDDDARWPKSYQTAATAHYVEDERRRGELKVDTLLPRMQPWSLMSSGPSTMGALSVAQGRRAVARCKSSWFTLRQRVDES